MFSAYTVHVDSDIKTSHLHIFHLVAKCELDSIDNIGEGDTGIDT